MMRALATRLGVIGARAGLGVLLAGACVAAAPNSAFAGGRHSESRGGEFRSDYFRGGEFRIGLDIPGPVVVRQDPPMCDPRETQMRETQVWVEPVYRTVCGPQWIAPVYRTVCDRVWVEPVVRNDCQRVWVPDRYEWRDVVRYEYGHRRVCPEWVLVEAGHFEMRDRPVVITPGHYEDVQRQELVCAGHWENVEHQELVTPGHWESRPVYVERPLYEERAGLRVELRLPVR
jgi:hypothetical protein